jgi:hypothetical protein
MPKLVRPIPKQMKLEESVKKEKKPKEIQTDKDHEKVKKKKAKLAESKGAAGKKDKIKDAENDKENLGDGEASSPVKEAAKPLEDSVKTVEPTQIGLVYTLKRFGSRVCPR